MGKKEETVLEDGSTIMHLNLSKKESNTMYEAALLENKLTLRDLEYQLQSGKRPSFKQLVVGAFVLQALSEITEKEQPE